MFRLRIEIDIPTEEVEEARLIQDHMKAYIERGLGFQQHNALHNIGIDRSIQIHTHSYYAHENGIWSNPSHNHNHEVPETWRAASKLAAVIQHSDGSHSHVQYDQQFSDKEKEEGQNFFKNFLQANQEDFLDEEDMKIK